MRAPPTKLEQALESTARVIVGGLLASIVGMYLYVLFVVVRVIISSGSAISIMAPSTLAALP